MKVLFHTWRDTFRLLNRRPKILIPFTIMGAANLIAAYLLYYAPQRPISYLLAPPIRKFFGEKFLHYPFNFYLLPQLFGYAEVVVSAVIGILMTAMAVGMIADAMLGHEATFLINFFRSINRYFSLLIAWGFVFTLVFLTSKYLPKILVPGDASQALLFTIFHFLGTIITQLLFIYIVPIMIIKNKNIFVAFKDNIIVIFKLFFPTMVLGLIPVCLYIPTVLLKAKTAFLVNALFPEVILGVVVIGIIASVVVEVLVITATTVLFVNKEVK